MIQFSTTHRLPNSLCPVDLLFVAIVKRAIRDARRGDVEAAEWLEFFGVVKYPR